MLIKYVNIGQINVINGIQSDSTHKIQNRNFLNNLFLSERSVFRNIFFHECIIEGSQSGGPEREDLL